MVYTYNDFLPYIPELKKYVKSKVKTDWWKDVVQETLLYLHMKFDKLIITNIKGLIFNTANFFINKHFGASKIEYRDTNDMKFMYNVTENSNPVFKLGDWNSYKINDKLFYNLSCISKTLFEPFEMQMNDKSVKEIALELNLNENTVKTRIKRCKDFLKNGVD